MKPSIIRYMISLWVPSWLRMFLQRFAVYVLLPVVAIPVCLKVLQRIPLDIQAGIWAVAMLFVLGVRLRLKDSFWLHITYASTIPGDFIAGLRQAPLFAALMVVVLGAGLVLYERLLKKSAAE